MRKEIKDILDYARYCIAGETDRIPMINMLIYYAQYLSIQDRYKPLVWSNFFNINGVPYMTPLIAEPKVDYSNITEYESSEDTMYVTHFIQLALIDLSDIHNQLGIDGVQQFIGGICDMQGRPSVDPFHMLYYALKSKDKQERLLAKQVMQEDERNKVYTTIAKDDSEEAVEISCTKYAQ